MDEATTAGTTAVSEDSALPAGRPAAPREDPLVPDVPAASEHDGRSLPDSVGPGPGAATAAPGNGSASEAAKARQQPAERPPAGTSSADTLPSGYVMLDRKWQLPDGLGLLDVCRAFPVAVAWESGLESGWDSRCAAGRYR